MDTQETTNTTKDQMLQALAKHIAKRTGMDIRNYASNWGDTEGVRAFRSEYRSVLRDGVDARILLQAVWRRSFIDIDLLLLNQENTRLTFNKIKDEWDYCVGQYWATEYRSAVCRYLRDCLVSALRREGYDYERIKKELRHELGRGIINRWFY